jgi:hypothetical protein
MLTSIILSAENDALRKATATQPAGLSTIPRPEKGVAGNGFNLRAAMELGDDHTLYCTVRVSLIFYYLHLLSNHTIPSVAFGTWWIELD